MKLTDIETPAALIDEVRMTNNIARLQARMTALGVRLRPHVKTSKCIEVARRQQAAGAAGISSPSGWPGACAPTAPRRTNRARRSFSKRVGRWTRLQNGPRCIAPSDAGIAGELVTRVDLPYMRF